MKKGQDLSASFPDIKVIHHNLPGRDCSIHQHDEHEIVIPLLGETRFEFADRSLKCGVGKMVYIPPKHSHSFYSSKQLGERLIALISAKCWNRNEAGCYKESLLPLSQLVKELIVYLLLYPKNRNSRYLVETLVVTMDDMIRAGSATKLLEPSHLTSKAVDPRLRKALTIMAASFSSGITVDAIAQRAGASTRSLTRIFSIELGLTPKQVLTHFRIATAKHRLETGQVSVTDVCYEVGYGSLSNFIKNFQALTGRLPSEIAKSGRKR